MEQTLRLAHSGWSQEETELLLREIQAAADSGEPLRSVFEKTGEALGRKPNSVRNYYYMQLREQTIGQCLARCVDNQALPHRGHLVFGYRRGNDEGVSFGVDILELIRRGSRHHDSRLAQVVIDFRQDGDVRFLRAVLIVAAAGCEQSGHSQE